MYDSETHDKYLENEIVIESEMRVSFKGLEATNNYPWSNDVSAVALRQGRAVSNIELNVKWYQTYMEAIIVKYLYSHNTQKMPKNCNFFL